MAGCAGSVLATAAADAQAAAAAAAAEAAAAHAAAAADDEDMALNCFWHALLVAEGLSLEVLDRIEMIKLTLEHKASVESNVLPAQQQTNKQLQRNKQHAQYGLGTIQREPPRANK